jgi:hypothetical protein
VTTTPVAAPEPSPLDAATEAYEHTRRHLFPFKFERWLALGLVTFLDQCGRGGMGLGPNLRVGNPFPSGGSSGARDVEGVFGEIGAWMGAHVALVVGIAALGFALIVAISALILWINSRATFVYVENVATGGIEIARPWRAHAERARSYFAWRFGLAMGVMVAVLFLVGLGIAAVLAFHDHGYRLVVAALVLVPLLLLLIVAAGLLSLAFRDFAAPIQMVAGVSCGAALRLVARLVRAHPLAFFLYVVLKVVFGIAQGIIMVAAACLTCCCILIPVVTQTFLQPLFFFERAWPLYLLRQLGYDLVTGPTASAPVAPAPLQPAGGGAA